MDGDSATKDGKRESGWRGTKPKFEKFEVAERGETRGLYRTTHGGVEGRRR
jgi:hypothetical protein